MEKVKLVNSGYRFFDFCAGIGAAHLAFKNIGFDCVGYSEINKHADDAYKLFHGTSYKNYGDLMKIKPETLDDFDVLIAGFPCQTFSIVGNRKGFGDVRGQVIFGLAEILRVKQPKAFLLENVKGLLSIENGDTIKDIVLLLRRTGYDVFYQVLESTQFGIPQMRERVYIVGIRNDLHKQVFYFPETTTNKVLDLKSFLIDEDERFVLTGTPYKKFLKKLDDKYNMGRYKINELLKDDFLIIDTRYKDIRLYYDSIPTLTTKEGLLYVKNGKVRKLSGLENLLLQGFGIEMAQKAQDNFTISRIIIQAGNAMTVNVVQEIGNSILEYLDDVKALPDIGFKMILKYSTC